MNTTVILFLVFYYVVVIGIGVWSMRRGATEDLEGYLLGGRNVGPMVTALTLQSTAMSGKCGPKELRSIRRAGW